MLKFVNALLIVSMVLTPHISTAQEICTSSPESLAAAKRTIARVTAMSRPGLVHTVQGLYPLDERLRQLQEFPPRQQMTPWGAPISPFMYGQYGQPEKPDVMPPDIERDLVPDARVCLGQYQCLHKHLHPYYKVAFAKLGCHCHTGKCRPTESRRVSVSATNETGYQVLANGKWCDVPASALRRDRQLIPPTLLQFRAHVCVSETSCAELECAIIDEGT